MAKLVIAAIAFLAVGAVAVPSTASAAHKRNCQAFCAKRCAGTHGGGATNCWTTCMGNCQMGRKKSH